VNSVDAFCEFAPLYAIGALDAEDLRTFESHLDGCSRCLGDVGAYSLVAEQLALLTSAAPPPTLRDRLLASLEPEAGQSAPPIQVWKDWTSDVRASTDQIPVVRAAEGGWEPTGRPGISVRRLSVDPERQSATMLVRMEPGASYPPHVHASAEECYVIQGDLHVGESVVMGAGDYQRAPGGTVHPVQFTEGGCVLFILSSLNDELTD
jgi:anti-sigma factor ChrR (cupin superfamily)